MSLVRVVRLVRLVRVEGQGTVWRGSVGEFDEAVKSVPTLIRYGKIGCGHIYKGLTRQSSNTLITG